MNLFLLALLPFAAQAEQKCYTGTMPGPEGKDLTKDDLLAAMHPMLGAAFGNVVLSEPGLKEFMKTRGTCQLDCLQQVVKPTMSTLYGKMGKELMSDAGKEMGIEAITGAVRACYPSPPRAAIKEVATQIINGMGKPVTKNPADFPMGNTCKNAGHEDDFPLKQVLGAFKDAFQQVAKANPKVLEFFQTKAMDCQFPCLDATVPVAMKTLFLTDQSAKQVRMDAVTGAMHACFPGVPSHEIGILVKKTVGVMEKAQSTATLRLYASKWLIKDGSFNFFPLLSMVTAAAIMLFSAGVALGRVWKRSAHRQIPQSQDEEGLIEMQHPE
jgi:hypothetical protein